MIWLQFGVENYVSRNDRLDQQNFTGSFSSQLTNTHKLDNQKWHPILWTFWWNKRLLKTLYNLAFCKKSLKVNVQSKNRQKWKGLFKKRTILLTKDRLALF